MPGIARLIHCAMGVEGQGRGYQICNPRYCMPPRAAHGRLSLTLVSSMFVSSMFKEDGMMKPAKSPRFERTEKTRGLFMGQATIATALFIPAMVGLMVQMAAAHGWADSLLILALLLLGPEQAHMAGADLRQIQLVQRHHQDPRLQSFQRLVWATIGGQLLGFYLAAMGQFGEGIMVILSSLIGFNLLASIRLAERNEEPIVTSGPQDRIAVLMLNGVAGSLGYLWCLNLGRFWAAAGILLIVGVYLASKFGSYYPTWRTLVLALLTHAGRAAEQHPQPRQ
jgi:hypothetical protein